MYLPDAGGRIVSYPAGRFPGTSNLGIKDLGAGKGSSLLVGNGTVLLHREAPASTRFPVNLGLGPVRVDRYLVYR